MFADLHAHLYGCFSPQSLFAIGKNNPAPKWERFIPEFERVFGQKIKTDTFFRDYADPEKFRKLYVMDHPGTFEQFQSRFNLIIALTRFDENEIYETAIQVVAERINTGLGEYRIMYSPFETDEGYIRKTIAACEGFRDAGSERQGRLSLSLHRQGDYLHKYRLIRDLMAKNSTVRDYLTSIDFCAVEEGNPPSEKREFLKIVKDDNRSDPSSSLAVLYHVGESYQDKSPGSAVRWVIEAARFGAHRLGHCIALGKDHQPLEIYRESAGERKAQLTFELENYESIINYGELSRRDKLEKELRLLQNTENDAIIEIPGSSSFTEELTALQQFGIAELKSLGTVVESCPTSNIRIGMLKNIQGHPVKKFADSGLKLTIGTDDYGIFATDMETEYELAGGAGISAEKLDEIRKNSFSYRSEILSGRK